MTERAAEPIDGGDGTVVLVPTPVRSLGYQAVAVAHGALGVWIAQQGIHAGWWLAGSMAILFLLFGIKLLPGSEALTLGPGGIGYRTLYGTRLYPWTQLAGVALVRVYGSRYVALDMAPAGPSRNDRLVLSERYGLAPDALARLIEEKKVRWG